MMLFGCGSQLVTAPLVALTEARCFRGSPPTAPKLPPSTRLAPFRSIASTELARAAFVTSGSNAVGAPVVVESSATRLRACPPIVPNWPPTKTVPPSTRKARTTSSAPGFQAASAPVVASTRAMRERAVPFTDVNVPPR